MPFAFRKPAFPFFSVRMLKVVGLRVCHRHYFDFFTLLLKMKYFIIAIILFSSYFVVVPELLKKYWPENIENSKILKF